MLACGKKADYNMRKSKKLENAQNPLKTEPDGIYYFNAFRNTNSIDHLHRNRN